MVKVIGRYALRKRPGGLLLQLTGRKDVRITWENYDPGGSVYLTSLVIPFGQNTIEDSIEFLK